MQPPKLLVLDLDETLIYATKCQLDTTEDFRVNEYFVYKRPHLNSFLTNAAQHFNVGVWSSAGDEYVHKMVENLETEANLFKFIWGRSKCTTKKDHNYDSYYFEKKLTKLKKQGYPLEQIIIVDDSPEKAASNFGNAVYILPFTGAPDDKELLYLNKYLLTLKNAENLRSIEKRGWRNAFV